MPNDHAARELEGENLDLVAELLGKIRNLINLSIELNFTILGYVDYFGYGGRDITFINTNFWSLPKYRLLKYFPDWFWIMLYMYVVIGTHFVFVLLFTRLFYEHFVGEPRRLREELRLYRER